MKRISGAQEVHILGRKLYAAFERKAGKLDIVNPGLSHALGEDNLSFCQQLSGDTLTWAVYPEALQQNSVPNSPVLKRGAFLLEVIAWCHFNGILDSATQLDFQLGEHHLSEYELHNIARTLQQLFPANKPRYVDNQAYNQSAIPGQILLFINVAVDPMKRMKTRGLDRLSDRTDSLGYSGLKENLVLNIEQLSVNSWGEISSKQFNGTEALLDCIRDYMDNLPPDGQNRLPQLDIRCFCPSPRSRNCPSG